MKPLSHDHSFILEVENLIGGYSGLKPVLHDLSFRVGPGQMIGLVGLNGAGKSTTIKHILGLLEPTQGAIRMNGKTRYDSKEDYHAHMAYIPENPALYEQLTLWEHLELTALAYHVEKSDFTSRAERLMKEFRMERMRDWLPETFSKGMKQKVMIMNAFLVQPSLYVIDEPFVGLDPRAIHSLLALIQSEKERGAGILMSTHILSTVEKFCDRFILLHEGRILLKGTLDEWREQTGLYQASLDDIFMKVTEVERNE